MMINETELQKIVETVSLEHFDLPFRHRAVFNNRLRTTGGRYLLASHDIEINPKMLVLGDDVLVGIIKHELCHYHLHLQHRGYRHSDLDFKILLKSVGALRYAPSINVRKTRPYRYLYQCRTCGIQYKRKRKMDTKKYVCSQCHGKIYLVKKYDY